jgi:hypothetical protein
LASAPSAVVNAPAATNVPSLRAASACTTPFIPAPSADQEVPFQRATRPHGTPPAVVNLPPATTSPFGIRQSAST